MNAVYAKRVHAGYVPLDEWLEQPAVRITRALKHFDWASSEDIFQALDLSESDTNAHAKALHRLVESGNVDRVGAHGSYRYKLLREIPAPKLPEPLPQDGDERQGEFFWRGKWRKNGERL